MHDKIEIQLLYIVEGPDWKNIRYNFKICLYVNLTWQLLMRYLPQMAWKFEWVGKKRWEKLVDKCHFRKADLWTKVQSRHLGWIVQFFLCQKDLFLKYFNYYWWFSTRNWAGWSYLELFAGLLRLHLYDHKLTHLLKLEQVISAPLYLTRNN